jgi:ribonuclease Z
MTLKIHFLGTSCMMPTKDRNHIGNALQYEENLFIFDCGENTQTQIKKMKLPFGKIKKIFISHWHGDHVIGLPGLLMSLGNTQGIEKIEIHGPKKSKEYISHLKKSCIFDSKINIDVYEHSPKENELKTIIDNSQYEIKCVSLNHSVDCIAYSFAEKDSINIDKLKAKKYGIEKSPLLARIKMGLDIEYNGKKIRVEDLAYIKKGKKISFVFDTRPCKEIDLLISDSDYLVMEATYLFSKHSQKAEEYDHMSAKETAQVALDNGVKNLVITHFSQRYKDVKELEDEAKEIFKNTIAANDLMTIKIR